jgi:hypothetical protein
MAITHFVRMALNIREQCCVYSHFLPFRVARQVLAAGDGRKSGRNRRQMHATGAQQKLLTKRARRIILDSLTLLAKENKTRP